VTKPSRKAAKSPQQKKAESYAKDRRNTYGENQKSSRKNIARKKRLRAREERRKLREVLVHTADEVAIDLKVDQIALQRRNQGPAKVPDAPLGVVLARKLARRSRARSKS
jgi:predicted NAD-dependent protein-ADP-ribosyltransferase YbiA (DUF1768 family)